MSQLHPYQYMEQVSASLHRLESRDEIETVLDEMEYLFEVIPPDSQDIAEKLITILRAKLKDATD